MATQPTASPSRGAQAYEPPTLEVIGGVWERTLNGCWWGKELGGTDGFTFMGINVPISNCSA